MIAARQLLQVPGDPVRLAQFGRARDHGREVGQVLEQVALPLVPEQRGVIAAAPGVAGRRGRVQQRADPGVRVLHVEDRVVVAAPRPLIQVHLDRRVHRVPRQRVPGRVRADRGHHVRERDHVAGALGHPHRLAVAQQADQLADEDLQGGVRVVAEARGHRPHPAGVAVVVGAEHDQHLVEAAAALVQVVRAVGGEIGVRAVAAHDDPVLVVAERAGRHPHRAVGPVHVPEVVEPAHRRGQLAPLVQRPLGEIDVELHPDARPART